MTVGNSAFCSGRRLALIAVLACWPALCGAQTSTPSDGLSTSAEYIAGFVRHVRWQAEEQLPAWRVCVIGDLSRNQARAYDDRTVRGKPFAVSYVEADAPLSDCQVLDLTAVDIRSARQVLSRIRKMPILTVGSGSGFCSAGGHICLQLGDDGSQSRQKFAVNLSTIKESALEVSARLLTVGSVHAMSDSPP
jgi:hypothetical protein